ncbi:hypothetical protein Taro_035067 [Colocasia esculenta]|uniref:glutathione transferase n=1 Tax=Colocasia esculenta TaxID=4460 RepID=A0A843W9F1_COLES|nr:hypothetical protein [Colocasia esculenta]
MGAVKVLGTWASPFALRVEWALKLKGVEYEYANEDLLNKSAELLRYSPVYKKVPVLVHGGHPVAESLVIIEYIDEVWKDGPAFLPADPYERAQARFWARFTEDKILPGLFDFYLKAGEEQKKAAEELKENLKTFGGSLKGKKLFGGETIGYVDIVAGWLAYWLPVIEEIAGVSIVEELPEISAWFDELLRVEVVKQCLPPREKIYDLNRKRREHVLATQGGHP